MGEIIFSICVGGFLVLSGIVLNMLLRREEKRLESGNGDGEDCS